MAIETMFKIFSPNQAACDSTTIESKYLLKHYLEKCSLNLHNTMDVVNILNTITDYLNNYTFKEIKDDYSVTESKKIRNRARIANVLLMLMEVMDYLSEKNMITFKYINFDTENLKVWVKNNFEYILVPETEILSDEEFDSWINQYKKLPFKGDSNYIGFDEFIQIKRLTSTLHVKDELEAKGLRIQECISRGEDQTSSLISYFTKGNGNILCLLRQCAESLPLKQKLHKHKQVHCDL